MFRTAYSSIPEKLHLVITGETGTAFSFVLRRDRIALLTGGLLLTVLILGAGSWLGAGFFWEKNVLDAKTAQQADELNSLHARFTSRLEQELSVREKKWQKQE